MEIPFAAHKKDCRGMKILLPAITTDRFMSRLSRANCDIFNPQLTIRDSWLPISMYWNKFKSTY